MTRTTKVAAFAIALSISLTGCLAAQLPHVTSETQVSPYSFKGVVDFGSRKIQATIGEVANAATVSLIDAGTGNTVGSSVTNAAGAFVLTFSNFTPTSGTPYILEAVKGLAVGGSSNRAGASAARLRTLLYWNNGWQSLTNSTPGTGIMVSSGTTALAILTSLKKGAGINLDLSKLVNTVSGSTFNEAGTGLSNANDFQPVLGLVSNALTLDQDPVGAISFNHLNNTYALATGVPVISSVSPSIGTPGETVTLKGAYLDALSGRNTFWFGTIPASTWSVSADRTTATVTIPASAYSAPFTLQQPNGVVQTLSPFYKLHGTVGTLAGNGAQSYGDGVGIDAQFNRPRGITMDSSGNIYLADQWNHRIRKITPSGVVTTFAGSGATGSINATGLSASFNWPTNLKMDSSGDLYVVDYYSHAIRKITPAGVVTTFAGSTTSATGSVDGTGTAALFNGPGGLALDSSGNLYVAEYLNHKIRKITPAGVVSTYAGTGIAGVTDGATSSAQFNGPLGVCVDDTGNVFVADYTNHRIRKITPAGVVSTLAGSSMGFADGTGSAAQFRAPSCLKIDSSGNLYVVDAGNHRIRKVTSSGIVTTFAGSGTAGFADGASASAQFNNPYDICLDHDGNMFVADLSGHRVRVITP